MTFAEAKIEYSRSLVRNPRLHAIAMMCVAVSLFACLDATAKHLMIHSGLPTTEVVWMRFVGQFIGMMLLLGPAALPSLLSTKKPWHQMSRSVLMVGCTALNFIAIQYMRLDQVLTIAFLTPLMVAALAGPLLGEWVGRHRLAAIIAGFIGVLLVVRPGVAEVHPAVLAALASMLCYAFFMLLTRYLADYDPPFVTLFYALIVGTVGAAPLAIAQWVWPASTLDWVLLSTLGVFGGTGHYLLILAYRLAPASSIAPFLYVQILATTTLGFIIFGEMPDFWTVAGSAIIIASGLYLLQRERVQGVKPIEASPPA